MQIPLEIAMEGSSDTRWVSVSRPEYRAEVVLPHRPFEVRLDPDWMVFRRLSRSELPPMLNGFVTDRRQTVIKAFSDAASPLSRIPARLMDQAAHEQGDSRTVVLSIGEPIPATGSILILAEAEQRQATQSLIRESCGDRVALEENGFQIDGQRHAGPAMAVLVSCRRAGVPGSVLSVLYGITPQAVANVSRLLFYYGWHSVVVFQDGAVVRRDVWEASPNQKEVQVHANR
jgi:aminopeptidase N